jgi:hypothetical protein
MSFLLAVLIIALLALPVIGFFIFYNIGAPVGRSKDYDGDGDYNRDSGGGGDFGGGGESGGGGS